MRSLNSAQKFVDESETKTDSQKDYISFVSAGIACNALTLIHKSGVLEELKEDEYFSEKELENKTKYKNPVAIKSALLSLCLAKVLIKRKSFYFLTELGRELIENLGLVSMLFEGYSELFAHQVPIATGEMPFDYKYINGGAIAEASIKFSENTVEPILIELIKTVAPRGTICDLGCGCGSQLLKICQATNKNGLGFDCNKEAIQLSKTCLQHDSLIRIEEGDITNLEGVWEDVEILLQNFVFHDISPNDKAAEILQSYQKNFPNMKYFFSVDIVTPCESFSTHMPGFDYIHGLQGIETRNYQETHELFKKAGYEVEREIPIPKMPNTFLWVLKPKREISLN